MKIIPTWLNEVENKELSDASRKICKSEKSKYKWLWKKKKKQNTPKKRLHTYNE